MPGHSLSIYEKAKGERTQEAKIKSEMIAMWTFNKIVYFTTGNIFYIKMNELPEYIRVHIWKVRWLLITNNKCCNLWEIIFTQMPCPFLENLGPSYVLGQKIPVTAKAILECT